MSGKWTVENLECPVRDNESAVSEQINRSGNVDPRVSVGMENLPVMIRGPLEMQLPARFPGVSTDTPSVSSTGSDSPRTRYITFKAALEFIPKSYDGQNMPVNKFIRDCLFAQESIHPAEKPLLLKMVRSRLCGPADAGLLDQNIHTLEDLLQSLKLSFSSTETVESLTTMLSTIAQRNGETVEAYGVRACKILNDLMNAIREEKTLGIAYGLLESARESALRNFMRGLSTDIEMRVRLGMPKTIQEAICIGKTAEWEVTYQSGLSRSKSDPESGNMGLSAKIRRKTFHLNEGSRRTEGG